MLSEGYARTIVATRFYVPDACYDECLAGASCEELRATLCGESIDLLVRCDQRCAFHCTDGALVALEAVCDGRPQCSDGIDEAGCPSFSCNDGTPLPLASHCNGFTECAGGEDERDCPCPTSQWLRCDGVMHCPDGADERDCSTFQCADGQEIPYFEVGPRCDGWRRCNDGSDELDCAMLTPICAMP